MNEVCFSIMSSQIGDWFRYLRYEQILAYSLLGSQPCKVQRQPGRARCTAPILNPAYGERIS